jgi:hypothetical protein
VLTLQFASVQIDEENDGIVVCRKQIRDVEICMVAMKSTLTKVASFFLKIP